MFFFCVLKTGSYTFLSYTTRLELGFFLQVMWSFCLVVKDLLIWITRQDNAG
jgi:hypothetical protein